MRCCRRRGRLLHELLRALRIDELKELCRALGLDAPRATRPCSSSACSRIARLRAARGAAGTGSAAGVRLGPGSGAREDRVTKERIVKLPPRGCEASSPHPGPSGQHRTTSLAVLLKRRNDAGPPYTIFPCQLQARWTQIDAIDPMLVDHALNLACESLEKHNAALDGVLSSVDFTDERRFGGRRRARSSHVRARPYLLGLPLRDEDLATP